MKTPPGLTLKKYRTAYIHNCKLPSDKTTRAFTMRTRIGLDEHSVECRVILRKDMLERNCTAPVERPTPSPAALGLESHPKACKTGCK